MAWPMGVHGQPALVTDVSPVMIGIRQANIPLNASRLQLPETAPMSLNTGHDPRLRSARDLSGFRRRAVAPIDRQL